MIVGLIFTYRCQKKIVSLSTFSHLRVTPYIIHSHACARTFSHICTPTHTHTHTHTLYPTHTHVRARAHTHTHTHVQKYRWMCVESVRECQYFHTLRPQTEKIALKIITTAKISNQFSLECPYISNTFSRDSPRFQTSFHVSKRESLSLTWTHRNPVRSGNPNIWSLISFVSGSCADVRESTDIHVQMWESNCVVEYFLASARDAMSHRLPFMCQYFLAFARDTMCHRLTFMCQCFLAFARDAMCHRLTFMCRCARKYWHSRTDAKKKLCHWLFSRICAWHNAP